MFFTPDSRLLVHSRAERSAAAEIARAALEPAWSGVRRVVPLEDFPPFGPESNKRAGRASKGGAALEPVGTCPETGRALHLAMRRDSSALILRQGPADGPAWEMLPAIFTLVTESWARGFKAIPYAQRVAAAPRLRLYPSAAGLHAALCRGEDSRPVEDGTEARAIRDVLAGQIEAAAGEVLAADGIADPRRMPVLSEGMRYAPFSVFPEPDTGENALRRLRAAAAALATIYEHDRADYLLCLDRTPPRTPWRQPSGHPEIRCLPDNKPLRRAVGDLAADPALGLPDALRRGDGSSLELATNRDEAPSRHMIIAGMAVVRDIFATGERDGITAKVEAARAARAAAHAR